MKVTVCELKDAREGFSRDWADLARHVKDQESELVLLPEMSFSPWFAWQRDFVPEIWKAAVQDHAGWKKRLSELGSVVVCGTAPVDDAGGRRNRAFVFSPGTGYTAVHDKYYLPDEEGFWEETWYGRGNGDFASHRVSGVALGFMICTEMWFFQHARAYGEQGVHLILCPRATPHETLDKWLAGGRAASVVSGAFCLSSNLISEAEEPADLGGKGWITDPDGVVLGVTSPAQPFLTLDIDTSLAATAKQTYPRYVRG
jgi:N-carbamoylputrescine amidase